jgi:hypothetical protein
MNNHTGKARVLLALAGLLASLAGRAADRDADGLDDAVEGALLERYAPVVLLHPSEPARPGSAEWLLARAELEPAPGPPRRVLAASIVGVFASRAETVEDPAARLHPAPAALAGSSDPQDWVAYGHAYPAEEGGVLLQYWFFYPFNDAYGLFDHEGDWEHMTVKLDRGLRPQGAYYARHEDAHPGAFHRWAALAREGDHPVVLAARGTHASYTAPADAPFWERVCSTGEAARAAEAGCTAWRTWAPGTGGVVDLGERGSPHVAFVGWPGRWGARGRLGMDSRTDPPPGPAFQAGWCSGAAPAGCP